MFLYSRTRIVASRLVIIIWHVIFLGNHSLASNIYEKSCARCHDSGLIGAPMPKSVDFQKRLELRGPEGLYESLLKGRARMPKRGGCFSCTDIELRQALEKMLDGIEN